MSDAKAIFLEAINRESAAERSRYIDEVCGDNSQLRQQISELLRAHKDAGKFLGGSAPGDDSLDQPVSEVIGTEIGPYKLRELVGEGGMGVVYVAQQEKPVVRKVALKIIKPGMDSKEVIARFEAERQALALMDHPNIARVLDVGTTDTSRPYFVMELVRGVAVTDHCQKHKLPTRERLELFIQLCLAVQHAHQKGIIHRDIKPSNVLVTLYGSRPVPKVIDFGVAKAINQRLTERTIYTHMSQMIGTPLYMSPEQAEMSGVDVDTRTDIYSLGVLLYELLTETTPFAKDRMSKVSYDELRRIIREEDPPKPSDRISTLAAEALSTVSSARGGDQRRITQLLRGELDWIVMKAMDKDMLQRYDSAGSFASDVQRYLDNEPVLACPPSLGYRLRKFANRNKVALSTAAIVLAALVAGILGTSWQAVRATQALQREQKQRQRAVESEQTSQRERQVSEANFRQARAAVDEYLTTVSESKLLNTPGMQPLRKDLLELALKYYQDFIAQRRDDPGVKAELAATYYRIGEITKETILGFSGHEALKAHQQALAIRKELATRNPEDTDIQHALAESFLGVADLQQRVSFGGPTEDALASSQAAIEILKPLQQPRHRHVLAKSLMALSDLYYRRFQLHGDTEARDQALVSRKEALEICKDLVEVRPKVLNYQFSLATCYQSIGGWLGNSDEEENERKHEQAREAFENALGIREALLEKEPQTLIYQSSLADTYIDLGILEFNTRNTDKAITAYRDALKIRQDLAEKNPVVVEYRGKLARTYQLLAAAYEKQEDLEGAIVAYQRATDIIRDLSKENPEAVIHQNWLANSYNDLGALQRENQQFDEAIQAHQHAIAINTKLVKEHQSNAVFQYNLSVSYKNLGQVQEDRGKRDEVTHSFEQALRVLQPNREMKDTHPRLHGELEAEIYGFLSDVQTKSGHYEKAVAAIRAQLSTRAQLVRTFPKQKIDGDDFFWTRRDLVTALQKCEQHDQVEALLVEQISTWTDLHKESHYKADCLLQQFDLHHCLARWLKGQGGVDEAERHFGQARQILEGLVADEARTVDAIVTCLFELREPLPTPGVGDGEEAKLQGLITRNLAATLELARSAVERDPEDGDAWDTWNWLALAHYRRCNWDGAEMDAELAVKLAADKPDRLLSIVPLFLLAGQEEEYWQVCNRMLDKWDKWSGKDVGHAASLCSHDPRPPDDSLLQLARRAVEVGPDWSVGVLNRVYYRIGEYERAIESLASRDASLDLAIAHHLAGHPSMAEASLENALRSLKSQRYATARMEVEVLRWEAERLIRPTGKDKNSVDASNQAAAHVR